MGVSDEFPFGFRPIFGRLWLLVLGRVYDHLVTSDHLRFSEEDYLWPVFHNMKIFDSTITGDAVPREMTIGGVIVGVVLEKVGSKHQLSS